MRNRLSKLLIATSLAAAAMGPQTESAWTASAREPYSLPSPMPSSFLDLAQVPADQRDAIIQAVELGLLTGGADGRFRPQAVLTRQELAVILTRILKLEVPAVSSFSFQDVTAQTWGRDYIEAVAAAGLMKGDTQHRFRVNAPVTRQELAAVLVQAVKNAQRPAGQPMQLKDAPVIAAWATPAVQTVIGNGWMEPENGAFLPKQAVKRQELARIMMEAFFPDQRVGVTRTVQRISAQGITINGYTYVPSQRVRGILNPLNQAILKGAKIQFEASGRQLNKIILLEITTSGTPAKKGTQEFSSNLRLDGKQGIVDGDVKVGGDYVSLANLTITGNLEIGRELENDFYASGIEVQGKTIVNGGDDNTVVFDGSNLADVDVNKTDVRVEALGQTFLQTMNVNANASIVGSSAASVDQINVNGAAKQVQLQGTVSSINMNTGSTLTGTAAIGKMNVQTTAPVTLNTTGTIGQLNVTQPSAAITVGANLKIGSLSTPSGVAPGSVISNYVTAQPQIGTPSGVAPVSALPANSAPFVLRPIKDFVLTLGEKKVIDLSQVFSDSDGNLSYYKALLVKAASAPELVTVTIDGNNLTVEAKLPGKITVRTQAYDSNNARVNHDFAVTVNRKPVAVDVPEQVATLGAPASTLDLGAFFSDPDGDSLTYKAVSGDSTVVQTSVSGKELRLQAAALGQTTVTITAEDGRGGSVTQDIPVRINRSPQTAAALADLKGSVGVDIPVDLTGAFQDPDGHPLTFEASVQPANAASAKITGSRLTLIPLAEGPVSITVTAKDGQGGSSKQTFTVNVNHSPKLLKAAEPQEIMVGKNDGFIPLDGMFSDEDDDPLTYEVHSASPGIATAALTGNQIQLSPVSGGTAAVSVTASDDRGGKSTSTFDVRVNAAPTVKQPIGPRSIQLAGGDVTLNLSNIFEDLNADPLTLSVESIDPSLIQASVSAGQLTLTPLAAGSATLKVTADDGHGGQVSDSFTVRINRAPQAVASIAHQLLTIGKDDGKVGIAGNFSDPDGDVLTYEVTSSDVTVASTSLTGAAVTIHPLQAGQTTLTVTARDSYGGEMSQTFDVKVNRSPIAQQPVQDRTVTLGTGDASVDLGQVFRDEDGDPLTVTASSLSESVASVSWDAAMKILTLHPLAAGTASIRLLAEDGRGGTQEQTFKVTVNLAPQAGSLDNQTLSLGSVDRKIDVGSLFSDADGDPLTLTVKSGDPGVALPTLIGNQLVLRAVALGTTSVTLTASDSRGGEAAQTITIDVQPNRSPIVAQSLSAKVVQPLKSIELDLASVFRDPDGDLLTYQAASADTGVASVSVVDQHLTLTGVTDGTSLITVTAQDIVGNPVQTTFLVNVVSNEAPKVVGTLPEQMLVPGYGASVTLDSVFQDSDGDLLTYTVQSQDGKVSPVVVGNRLNLTAGTGSGRTSVTVTADDGRGGHVSTMILVNVIDVVYQKTITTKTGIANIAYDLAPYFPGQQPFTVYRAEQGMLTQINTLQNNRILNLVPGSVPGTFTYMVVSSDGKAAAVQLNVQEQSGPSVFFSEYTRGPDGRIAVEVYNKNDPNYQYQVVGYRYNLSTNQVEIMNNRDISPVPYAKIGQIYPGTYGLIANYTFYDLMDITAIPYYNDELEMVADDKSQYVIMAFDLLKDGKIIDTMGDKNWRPGSGATGLPNLGTLIRKSGVASGSAAFDPTGEWEVYPLTYSFLGHHTP
ncbi:hypothetical protein B9G55_05600 [Saccharibacillus sp. O16]|nr:hypothetical protein B9G55_05600 [Saccharibacillus sp. O16]